MNRSFKIMIGLFVFLVLFIFLLEATAKEPLDWTPSYHRDAKIPLGAKIFFDQLQESDLDFQMNNRPPFELFSHKNDSLKTLLLINSYIAINGAETDSLLQWVERGNDVFMATSTAPAIMDTLNLLISGYSLNNRISYKPLLSLSNENFEIGADKLYDRDQNYFAYFKEIDTIKTTILGEFRADSDSIVNNRMHVNFIKVPFGKGQFYLHTMPEVFSNHFLLTDDNYRYTSAVMQFVDTSKPIVWDAYYKNGRETIDSLLHYLLNNKYLRITYYLLIISLIIFIFFEGKRKQKAIKIVKPLQNKSYEYVKTIADMYVNKSNHKKIAMLKIDLFFAKIRQKYHLQTQDIDKTFIKNLALKSEQSEEHIIKTFKYIERINQLETVSKKDLILLEEYLNPYQ
ncbi:hypothetical protein CAP47_04620 [Psychroflexus sp. S27]|uniref:DUF4350 domain-containing protein n=1 Tax=Psychroflexus sp. S27 TaxID=1982757 RepID=UPI000C2B046A|nr:DUF4350 domain-containing protein [Psychroflexus sp. S27]PJX23978.1 hypothetical protein CAP47_04620 [Psychroflexus sp. S27]